MAMRHTLLYSLVSLPALVLVCQVSQADSSGPPPPSTAEEKIYRMSDRVDDVMRLCRELSANEQIETAITHTGKAGAAGGAMMMAGGLIGGPPGIVVGAVVGGVLGYWMTNGQFKSIPQVIMEMTPDQKQKLYADVMPILGSRPIQWTDVAQLTAVVMGDTSLKQQVMAAIIENVKLYVSSF
ncbi:hypothetical protein ACEWY4_011108 [Coilia grayii]|uniref:Uncharacterized protein n=1 Tax=Coilia grayii TaxID=363190 RepID=A0ABD1K433_9TELE